MKSISSSNSRFLVFLDDLPLGLRRVALAVSAGALFRWGIVPN
jgi:hypothetical protein